MQSQSFNDYRFIMAYQDHLTKYALLRPLKTKRAEEIASHLLDIYTTCGAPVILHSDNGREFVNAIIAELYKMWAEVRIAHGKPRHSQSQGFVERANRDIEEMLAAWMDENETTDWPSGLKFIQFKYRALHSGIGKSPYEAMFGCPARVGLVSIGIPHDTIDNLSTEEQVESLLQEIEGRSEEIDDNLDMAREDQVIVADKNASNEENPENIDLGKSTNTENCIELGFIEIGNRIVCNQCFTVLPVDEEVNVNGLCFNCERENSINNERKRSRESLEKQAAKMLKLSKEKFAVVDIATTVRVPIPDVDRARGSLRTLYVLAVVMSVEDGFYKLCTTNGVLKHKYTRSEFNPCAEKSILLENLGEPIKRKEISLREAAAASSVLGSQGYKRCHF